MNVFDLIMNVFDLIMNVIDRIEYMFKNYFVNEILLTMTSNNVPLSILVSWIAMILYAKPESPILLMLFIMNMKKFMRLSSIVKAIVLLVLFYLQHNPLEPQLWKPPFSLPSINDKNDSLKNTKIVGKDIVLAPESLAIDNDDIYASLSNGQVVMLSKEGRLIKTIYFKGRYINDQTSFKTDLLSKECHNKALTHDLAWEKNAEANCGRPLGLRVKKINGKKLLFIVDSYSGVYEINLDMGTIEHIIDPNMPVYPIIKSNTVIDLTPKFYNDLDISADGTVYVSDSSYKNTRSENRKEVLDGAPRGRLFSFKAKKYGGDGLLWTKVCGLHFPNGVQFIQNSNSLMVVESARFRVLKLNLNHQIFDNSNHTMLTSCNENGSLHQYLQKSDVGISVLLDAAPGFMDNIRKGKSDNEYLIGVGAKSSKPFSLLYIAYQSNLLRNIIGRIISMRYIEYLVPKFGLVLVIDSRNGSVIKTYQDPSGKIASISEAQIHPKTGSLLLGSHSNSYLGILEKQFYD